MFKKQKRIVQGEIWINAEDLALPATNPFYETLDSLLASVDFDQKVRELCQPYYKAYGAGRPGTDPAVYIKMILIGFFEGNSTERYIETRCADSIMLHRFLGYPLTERVPDHTAIGVFRRKIPSEVFDNVFGLMHPALEKMGLLLGANVGMDTSVIEANASMRNLRNRLSGEKYREYVKKLAMADGIDPKDEAAVSRFDRKRKGRKTSNEEWVNPFDPDAKVGPTKHGDTRMIYKPEHVVDMDTGAIIDARVEFGDMADSTEVAERICESEVRASDALGTDELPIETLTTDKGYYSKDEIVLLDTCGIQANIPDRCTNRKLENLSEHARRIVEETARRVKSRKGKLLLRKRGMHIERSFAHILDAGGMRRTTLRGRDNIQKRYSIAALGYNISLMMCTIFGAGTPKQWAAKGFIALYFLLWHCLQAMKNACFKIGLIQPAKQMWSVHLSPEAFDDRCVL